MKATLITGASGGIGKAFARRLAAEKHNLVLVARTEEKLAALCDELMHEHKITAHYVALDLINYEASAQLFEETEKGGFEIDWLINNAGFGSMNDFAKLELGRELEMISLNVSALVALTHRYLQKMRERRSGVIINVSSTASFQPIPFMATYAATKAFVTSFSEAIAEENRPFNIKIVALCPGPTDTNFFNVANAEVFKAKGIETPGAVVETALKAVESGKSKAISGWTNYVGSVFGSYLPTAVVTRVVGKALRGKVEDR
ncbi:MAG: SDR family oxidoreductase [Acidobacteria bacterium]|nr:SDR family oxidoreductase [Acidobacteriota bacterium]